MTPPSARDVSCQELVELLADYLEGALTPDEVAAVEHHLALCDGCAAYLDQLRVTIDALGSVPVDTLPDGAVDELLGALRGLWP
ncbi:MAG TPA: zf-HC2 domain-containing protein [Ornithinibacter sp.]|nr:zf-HC2 domain-containing protein [Ornithinibacter sp.]